MRAKVRYILIFILTLLMLHVSLSSLFAYPDQEKAQLTITDVTAQAVQLCLTSDNRYLYVGFNDKVKVIDLATFDLRSSNQPYDFGSSESYSGMVGGLTLSSTTLFVTQDNGNMLSWLLTDLTAEPSSITLDSGKSLGKMAINSLGVKLYILNETDNSVLVNTIGSEDVATILLEYSIVESFSVTNMKLMPDLVLSTDYIYITTDKGLVFYIEDGQAVSNMKVVDIDYTDNLLSVAARADKEYIFVLNYSQNRLHVYTPPDLTDYAVIDFTEDSTNYNSSLLDVISTTVTNPSSSYTFISGLKGVSVVDVNNVILDVQGTEDHSPISISGERYGSMASSTDGYIYMSNEGGVISVITDNPYVTVSSVTYSSGGSSLGAGESATITFSSDEDGTYEIRVGGDVDRSGALLVDTSGASTGPITASTDTTFTFNYDDNSSNLDEGDNTVFVFVKDSNDNYGRRATTVNVDTPPPAVVITSTGFGTNKIYVNFNRLTVSDMSYYNVYVSTDAAAVVDKTVTPTQISQPSLGSTVAAEITGLDNDTLYYVSVEAVDAGGNVGPLTYTYADGSRVTGTPERTVGPAEMAGEKGCSLVPGYRGAGVPGCRGAGVIVILLFLLGCLRWFGYGRREGSSRQYRILFIILFSFLVVSLFPRNLLAEEATPQWWSTELKGGFWMPMGSVMKKFFDPCCNMTGGIVQGFLYQSKYGAEVGVSFVVENGKAKGGVSGTPSQDSFNLFLLPMETNFAFRADFKENQILVPYVKFGFDYVYFRQNLNNHVTNGVKTGLHGVAGVQILLDMIDQGARYTMENDFGVNDIYFILEGRYNWINNFGGGGLDLSSAVFSFGLLFEY